MTARAARALALCSSLAGCHDWASLRERIDSGTAADAAIDGSSRDAQPSDGDATLDAHPDAGARCASTCVAPTDAAECAPCAVRQIAPSSGRAIGSNQMTVRWDSRGFSAGLVRFELSDSASFSGALFRQSARRSAGQMQIDTATLADGERYFWRLVAVTDDQRDGEASVAWHVFVDTAGQPMNIELPPRLARAERATPMVLAGAPLSANGRGAAFSIERAARSVDFAIAPITAPMELASDAHYGSAVSVVGDVDGDGFVEYAVSSAKLSPDASAMVTPGTVWVFDGAGRRPAVALRRGVARDSFGFAISAAGDIDRDGYADFVIGAPGRREAMSGGCEPGFASVQFGSASFFDGAATALFDLTPESNGELTRIGVTVLGGYDFDGEPGDDLAVAAPGYGDDPCGAPSRDRSGRVYLYRGGSRALSQPYVLSALSRSELIGRLGYALTAARPAGQVRAQLVIAAIALETCVGDNSCRYDRHQGITLFQARDLRTTPTINATLARIGTLAESVDGSGEQTRVVAMDADRDGEIEFVFSNPQSAGTGRLWRKEIGPWQSTDASSLTAPTELALSTPPGARRGASLVPLPASAAVPAMLLVGSAGLLDGSSASLHVLFWTGSAFEPAALDPLPTTSWAGVSLPSW